MDNDHKVYELSTDFSLFKGDFKEKRFQLFNVTDGSIFRLNEVSYNMLSQFDGEKNVKEVAIKLKSIYNVDEEKLEEDFSRMIDEWVSKNVLIERS
ncbi:MAG: PqqD family protein [bacterium]|nr:PqqD family protein [bacterium]